MTALARAALGLAAVLATGCTTPSRCPGTVPLLNAHLARYPSLAPEDAYKLLHQASMGSEHAIPDRATAVAWMAREWEAMGDGPVEPLVDTLGTDARFARVHLRPWKHAGGAPDAVTDAFVRTANSARPDTAALSCSLDAMAGWARGVRGWNADSVRAMVRAERLAGYPAVHHSATFADQVRPAYRVVALPLIGSLLATLPPAR